MHQQVLHSSPSVLPLRQFIQVWQQLHLQPAVPNEMAHGPGKLRVLVGHSVNSATSTARTHINFLQAIHTADLRPPEGVCSLTLDSIIISADIFPPRQQRKAVRIKRPRSVKENAIPTGDSREATFDESSPPGTHEAFSSVARSSISGRNGRKRPNTSFAERPSPPQAMPPNKDYLNGSSAPRFPENLDVRRSPQSALDYAVLQLFIDGALRLSVLSTINNKLIPGLKVRANTFESGLADIAPGLWRPAYSLVGTGTVSFSINRTHGLNRQYRNGYTFYQPLDIRFVGHLRLCSPGQSLSERSCQR